MMAKPIRALELYYPMIQLLIKLNRCRLSSGERNLADTIPPLNNRKKRAKVFYQYENTISSRVVFEDL